MSLHRRRKKRLTARKSVEVIDSQLIAPQWDKLPWNKLRARAMARGLYKKNMTKAQVIRALNRSEKAG